MTEKGHPKQSKSESQKCRVSETAPEKRNILRIPVTLERTGLSLSTLRRLEKNGLFPRRIRISTRTCGHYEDEVDGFIADRERVKLTGKGV